MKILSLIIIYLFTTDLLLGDAVRLSQPYVVFSDSNENNDSYTITATNIYGADIHIDRVSFNGVHAGDFNITNDNCTNHTIAGSESCDISVAFTPQTRGIKNSRLVIHLDIPESEYVVFLTNYQSTFQDVQERIPPTMYDINISATLDANNTYDFKWSLIGYDNSFKCAVAMFDCSAADEGACGDIYGGADQLFASSLLVADSVEDINWTYKDQQAKKLNYSYRVTINDTPVNGGDWNSTGTTGVIRFYVVSEHDRILFKPSLSLIIPGGITNSFYDTSGRKLEVTICPDGGCSQ